MSFPDRLKIHLLLLGTTLTLSACQSFWTPSQNFGEPVRQAIEAQSVNPNAPVGNPIPTQGLDGAAAKSSVDNYAKSYENKPVGSALPGNLPNSPTTGISLEGLSR